MMWNLMAFFGIPIMDIYTLALLKAYFIKALGNLKNSFQVSGVYKYFI